MRRLKRSFSQCEIETSENKIMKNPENDANSFIKERPIVLDAFEKDHLLEDISDITPS